MFNLFENYFEIKEKLGEGSFGKIYKCRSKIDQQTYAVKIIDEKLRHGLKEPRKYSSICSLEKNNDMVQYYSSWQQKNSIYIVMEHCRSDLKKELD